MDPIQPRNYPAMGSDSAETAVVEEKPSAARVNYSVRQMKDAITSGQQRRKARKISQLTTFPNERLARDEDKKRADEVAQVFRHSKVGRLKPSNPHPARRSENRALEVIRQIKADEFLARKMVERKQTTRWVGDDIASHQGVLDHRGAPAVEFDRTSGATVQQPSGNSSRNKQKFYAAEFYSLLTELGTDKAEKLFHNLLDDQQEEFRDYCLKHVNLNENEALMELLF